MKTYKDIRPVAAAKIKAVKYEPFGNMSFSFYNIKDSELIDLNMLEGKKPEIGDWYVFASELEKRLIISDEEFHKRFKEL